MRLLISFLFALIGGGIGVPAAEIQWVGDDVVEEARQAVVRIELGSTVVCGFFASEDGLLVTAAGPLEDHHKAVVRTSRGEAFQVSHLAAMDSAKQVAVLVTGTTPPAWLKVNAQPATLGSACVLFHTTEEMNLAAADALLLARHVPGCYPQMNVSPMLSIATRPDVEGSTGAPLVSGSGRAVGMSYSASSRGVGTDYPQPLNLATTEAAIVSALDAARGNLKPKPWPVRGEVNPQMVVANRHFEDGTRLLRMGQVKEAEDHFRAALNEHPQNVQFMDHLAGCLVATGKLKEAQGIMEQVLRLSPPNHQYRRRMIDILMTQGEDQLAIKHCCTLLSDFPKYSYAWSQHAALLMNTGSIAEALPAMKTACELEPDCLEYWDMYARMLRVAGKLEEAGLAQEKVQELESLYFKLKYSSPKRG